MQFAQEQIGDTTVVTVKGRLDGTSSQTFADRVGALVLRPRPKLLVDFADVDFITSAGLRAMLQIVKRVKASGGAFALCAVQTPVREVLDFSGFAPMFSIHPARADAIAAFGA
jgi:anti-anti-sigma factor